MFEQSGNDIKITFPDKNIKPVIFKDFNTKIDTDEHISSALGIQMLESAYKEMLTKINNIEDKMSSIAGGMHFWFLNVFLTVSIIRIVIVFLKGKN